MRYARYLAITCAICTGSSIVIAQSSLKLCTASGTDNNLRLQNTYGYSVSAVTSTSTYSLYALSGLSRYRWNAGKTSMDDVLLGAGRDPLCANVYVDPPPWDDICSTDRFGLFTIPMSPPDNHWSAKPNATVDTDPSPTVQPTWPNLHAQPWGTTGYAPLLRYNDVNTKFPHPPQSGNGCHPYNPADLATSVSNPKAVQVSYSNGTSRWFMAFNEEINHQDALENWRVLWAHSDNGQAPWTVDTLLFRSLSENNYCGGGLLVTDMLVDEGKFYVLVTDLNSDLSYLARATISTSPTAVPGYDSWSVASYPIAKSPSSGLLEYTWKPLNNSCPPSPCLGEAINWETFDAVSMFPSRYFPIQYQVKQASVGRIFDYTSTGSTYFAVTRDNRSSTQEEVQLWHSPSLSTPFTYDSTITMTGVSEGGAGWEFGFTHFPNNGASTPQVRRNHFDLWIVQNLGGQIGGISVTRREAQVSDMVVVPISMTAGSAGTAYVRGANPSISYGFGLTGGTNLTQPFWAIANFNAGTPGTTMKLTVTDNSTDSTCGTTSLVTSQNIQVDFADVPGTNQYHDTVNTLARNGVSAGCGSGNFCPDGTITRKEMAVFLIKGKHGSSYVPPAAVGIFSDVPMDSFAPYIEAAYNEGKIMDACGTNQFCPGAVVTRSDMAKSLLTAQRYTGWVGYATYAPPAAVGIFSDVPAGSPAAPWIEQVYHEGITAGCGAPPLRYCPSSSITRGQMSVFIDKTFRLQWNVESS